MTQKKALKNTQPPSERVKKHVAAIHTSGILSLLERKMVNVLLLNAYDALLTRRTHTLPIRHLCAMLGWDESNNIERLQDVLRKLASTPVEFNMMEDGKEVWRVMSMLSYGEIKDGTCTYRYDEYLAERFYDPEIYATINIGIQRRFEGSYALTLYENCLRYKVVGSTGWWELNRFKKIVGATASMYDEFKYLKRDVIIKPVEEINRISDIQLLPEFQKQGRKVTAVRFLITENPQQTLLKPVIQDDHEAIRETKIFKRLLEHGIGERLAILWVLQDEDRAQKVVEYVEARARKKEVKGSTAGYIRKLYESDAVVGKTPFETKKEQEEHEKIEEEQRKALDKRRTVLEAEYLRGRTNEAVNALSFDDISMWAKRYAEETGVEKAKSYNAETAEFLDRLERLQFLAWLRKQLAPKIKPAEFKAWLKDKEKGHDANKAG
ncbi:replication initiation protein [Methylicorpusculum oleiharenae]|uniref:replication initiation protein n=1 Tax=Methylicorpusculum oleiharenae TaxID=1338687 RepID=UPI00135B90D0|nr:replication initiation protein [Methylicorpusculum oleiharenae]MCD2453775.1 replication initiation protein [Methylicorpusculum oleiharenae]